MLPRLKKNRYFIRYVANGIGWRIGVTSLILAIFTSPALFDLLYPHKHFYGRNLLIRIVVYVTLFFILIAAQQLVRMAANRFAGNNHEKRIVFAGGLFAAGILTIFVLNNILVVIDIKDWRYQPILEPFAMMHPIGNDFRVGIYQPMVQTFLNGRFPTFLVRENPIHVYPPFTYALFSPLLLVGEDQAYLIATGLITLATLLCIVLWGVVINHYRKNVYITLILILLFSFYVFSSRYFMLMLERGNIDSIVLLFIILTTLAVIYRPDSMWLQIGLLSVAVHLKVYPALLLPFLMLHHGKKSILPAIAINVIFGLALGAPTLLSYLRTLFYYSQTPQPWIGNLSAASFSWFLTDIYPALRSTQSIIDVFAMGLPSVLYLISLFLIFRNYQGDQRWVSVMIVSLYMMCFIPTVSHDYKMVLITCAMMTIALGLLHEIKTHFDYSSFLRLVLFLAVLFLVHRSSKYLPEEYILLGNHYVTAFMLFVFTVRQVILEAKSRRGDHPEPVAAGNKQVS